MVSWKSFQKLKLKKYRQERKLFIVEGKRLCQEALESGWQIEAAFRNPDFQNDLLFPVFEKRLMEKNIPLQVLSTANFQKLADTQTPQGILLIMHIPQVSPLIEEDWKQQSLILLLDGIRDPGNLGTIIRTADWFGVRYLVSSSDTADFYNPKTIRASMGSLFRVTCRECSNLIEFAHLLNKHKIKILATSSTATTVLEETRVSFPLAILLGSEATGISPALLNCSSEIIQIKKYGQAESLNVAVATGILLNYFVGKYRKLSD